MLGAIAGDIVGSVYEGNEMKSKDFDLFTAYSHFTDDSVLTIAVADALLTDRDYTRRLHKYGNKYPNAGFGGGFYRWLLSNDPQPYNSWGNGSAMRVSPVAYVHDTLEDVLKEAKSSAEVTHNHLEGIKGAQAIASAIFLARKGNSKEEIRDYVTDSFGYDLDLNYQELIKNYHFDVSCQGSVPQAIYCFLISDDFEDAIRTAISIGGDSDTIAAMTGSIAEAYYEGVPDKMIEEVKFILPEELWDVISKFRNKFIT